MMTKKNQNITKTIQNRSKTMSPNIFAPELAAKPPKLAANPPEVAAKPPKVAAKPPEVAAFGFPTCSFTDAVLHKSRSLKLNANSARNTPPRGGALRNLLF